jgi:hypothetical protein
VQLHNVPVGVQNPDSSCRGPVVLVGETSEHILSANLVSIDRCRIIFVRHGSGERKRPVRPSAVVMLRVDSQHMIEVAAAEDKQ